MPKQAQVVFVVDASYSVGETMLAAELDIIRAYVAHLPDAQVEVVVYRRTAERLFGKMLAARDVGAALANAKIALGNGSALDAGARLAAGILAHRTGPRRVVLRP